MGVVTKELSLRPEASELEVARAAAALPALADAVARLGCQLDIHNVDDKDWTCVLRALSTVNTLGALRVVAVAGGQGAGKTTLVRSLYPAAGAWLAPNEGRGEKIPVAIVELDDVREPRGIVVRRIPGSTDNQAEEYPASRMDDWQRIVRGEDHRVLLVRVEVPRSQGFWQVEQTGFVLLPGFDRIGAHVDWQMLMRIVLVTSQAAVVVTDEKRMAGAAQLKVMEHLLQDVRTAGFADVPPVEVLIALNRCDNMTDGDIRAAVKRACSLLGQAGRRIVPFGAHPESPAEWPSAFREAAFEILPGAAHAGRQQAELLRELVRDDVADLIGRARMLRDQADLDSTADREFDETLQEFDLAAAQLLDGLNGWLEERFGDHFGSAASRLEETLKRTGGWQEIWQRGKDFVSFQPSDKDRRIVGMVEDAWDQEQARALQRECLEQSVRAAIRGSVGRRELSPEMLEPLTHLGEFSPGDSTYLQAIRLLPAVSLATRGFMTRFADTAGKPSGAGQSAPREVMAEIEGEIHQADDATKAMLAAAVAVGGLTVTGDMALPGTLAAPLAKLVTGQLPWSGFVLAHAWVAPVAAGALTLAALGRMGNKAMREREGIAHALLKNAQVETIEQVRSAAEAVVRHTRDILTAQLRDAFRLDDAQARAAVLIQAIRDTENARARMMGILSGADLA